MIVKCPACAARFRLDREKLVESLVQVVRDYPDVTHWKQKSIEAVLQADIVGGAGHG